MVSGFALARWRAAALAAEEARMVSALAALVLRIAESLLGLIASVLRRRRLSMPWPGSSAQNVLRRTQLMPRTSLAMASWL